VDSGEYIEYMGIIGKSVFFQCTDFDVVEKMLPEVMHLMDGGVFKNLMARTFQSGTAPQTKDGYRRVKSTELSRLIR